MPKQRHKPHYKRGVFKNKSGGPQFRPRGRSVGGYSSFFNVSNTLQHKDIKEIGPEPEAPKIVCVPSKQDQGRR